MVGPTPFESALSALFGGRRRSRILPIATGEKVKSPPLAWSVSNSTAPADSSNARAASRIGSAVLSTRQSPVMLYRPGVADGWICILRFKGVPLW